MTKTTVLVVLVSALATHHHPGLDRTASEADLLRAFAFGACISKGYQGTPFAEDAERSADIYMQGGKLGGDAYAQIRKLLPSELELPSPYDGHNYTITKCIEFYESPQLRRTAGRIAQGSK